METKRFDQVDALVDYVRTLGDGLLFRGQATHYVLSNGSAQLMPSQIRKGCIPSTLRKWTYYAMDAIRMFTGDTTTSINIELVQALLQHYGWRSFYLDITKSLPVAAWFGSHRFRSRTAVGACHECSGEFILLKQQDATYERFDGDGHLYILSRDRLEAARFGVIPLCDQIKSDFTTRFAKQSAWMIGAMQESLPEECILAHLSTPSALLAELAENEGFSEVEDVFPSRSEDYWLELLLSVPWQGIPGEMRGPVFTRGLELPEYDYKFMKHRDSTEAFYRPFWIADERKKFAPESKLDTGPSLSDITFYRVPEPAFYASPHTGKLELPTLRRIVLERRAICIESDGIISLPERMNSEEYVKGVVVFAHEDACVSVHAVMLSHPGTRVLGVGVDEGRFYAISQDGLWTARAHPEQCPCNNFLRHEQHLWILAGLEGALQRGSFRQIAANDFSYNDTPVVQQKPLVFYRHPQPANK